MYSTTPADRLAEAARRSLRMINDFDVSPEATCMAVEAILTAGLRDYEVEKETQNEKLVYDPETFYTEQFVDRIRRLRQRCQEGGHTMAIEAAHWQRIADNRWEQILGLRRLLEARTAQESKEGTEK